jgi:prepilin-type N-terminal cleavage/methylation domain-containing protein
MTTPLRDDDGVTMTELMVSLMIMAFMMAIFTTGIVQMYAAANKTESMSAAQSQVNLVFLRLDKEVRYSAAISDPEQVGSRWYVGMLNTTTNVERCTALQLDTDTDRLLIFSWNEANPPVAPGWVVLANNVDAPSGEQPFVLTPAGVVENFYRLRVNLVAESGGARTRSAANTDVTFTALNTSLTTSSTNVCDRYWRT